MYDLAHLLQTARRRWVVLLLCAGTVFAALSSWGLSRPERYEASNVLVLPSGQALLEAGVARADVERALGSSDELVLLETGASSSFRRDVAREAGIRAVPDRDELYVRQVQGPPGSRIESGRPVARITAVADDARSARSLASAAARLLADEQTDDVRALASEVSDPRLQALIQRTGALVAPHVDDRRAGRSSVALVLAAAGFVSGVVTLLFVVMLDRRRRLGTRLRRVVTAD